MRNLIFILIVLLCFSCKRSEFGFSNETKTSDTITNEAIMTIIDTLSSDSMQGRRFGTKGIEMAAVYIENFLKSNKIKPYFTSYRDSFVIGESIGYNLIGLIEGNDETLKNEYILLSAHYDHIGILSGQKDSVYNGANDNATGVSAVLNIARQLALDKKCKRSVIVALFTGEEAGLLGSKEFTQKIKETGKNIYCQVNIDMIGSMLKGEPGKVYLSGYEKSNMADVMNRYVKNGAFIRSAKADMMGVFSLSDNYPVYENLHIPAHTFCTFDFGNYKHYHKTSDEIQNIDMRNTGIIIRNIAKAVFGIANSAEREIKLTEE
ncbi:MAG: M28 family peptidase [Bacteroidales bacterium]